MEEINYRLGLDIGIASVGWAVLNLDKKRIEDLGVRIFEKAENQDGSSLATQRREARGRRRLLRRKAYRINQVKNLALKEGIVKSKDEYDRLFVENTKYTDIWELRKEALDKLITPGEWTRILVNLCKRRGFKSNRKNEEKDKKSGVLISSIKSNLNLMNANSYRTVGEMIYDQANNCGDPYKAKRNKFGQYEHCVSRKMIEDEVKILFNAQRKFGNKYANENIENKYLQIFNAQRPYAKFEVLEKMVGYCTFEKANKVKRAPKNSYSAEKFNLYCKLNNLSILSEGSKRALTDEERTAIVELAFKSSEVKYSKIRKILKLDNKERFSLLNYSNKENYTKTENCKFISMKGYNDLSKAIINNISKDRWNEVKEDKKMLNDIAYVLTLGKTDDDILEQMKLRNIPDDIIHAVKDLSFAGFINLSIVAIDKILPFLEEGYIYNMACEKAGYDFKAVFIGEKQKKLPKINKEEIINPVVVRAISQSIKVINAVIDKYGSPLGINIELARDLAKNFNDRKAIEKLQKENKIEKDKIKKELEELKGKVPTGSEILKYRLWQEQKEECAYSQERIPFESLFDGNYEIDHIIPFSRSFDDSLNNKVLVKGVENQRKGNRLPYEYFGSNEERWHNFEIWVEESSLHPKKKFNLLKKKFSREEAKEFKSRNLNDTRYISRYLLNFINSRLIFKDEEKNTKKVISINGRATAYLRAKWGLIKIREDGDKHHALDAAVIAAATQGMVNEIAKYSKAKELRYIRNGDEFIDIETGKVVKLEEYRYLLKDKLPRPWREFSEEVKMRLSDNPNNILEKEKFDAYDKEFIKEVKPIFVSRAPKRKVKGRLFKETVYSKNMIKGDKLIIKKALTELTKKDFDNIYNYNSDRILYDELYKKFEENGCNAKKAFKDGFRKPTRLHDLGPIVRSIKIETKLQFKEGVPLNNGFVAKDGIARVDFYKKDKKYYMVPVYRKDIALNQIPKKAAVANKEEKDWTFMDDTYKFLFSMFRNDLISIKFNKNSKKNKEDIFGYFKNFDRHTASIEIISHDNSSCMRGIGIKTGVEEITKYQVDVLGRYSKVRK